MSENDTHSRSESGIDRRDYMKGSAALASGAALFSGTSMAAGTESSTDEGSTYDMLLEGGHVIDPKNDLSAEYDVAIHDGEIAAVQSHINTDQAEMVVDVSGMYVTPGLIDNHTHLFFGTHEGYSYGGGYDSVWPDNLTFPYGVTTAVDTGSPGWQSIDEYVDNIVDHADTRIQVYVNIVGPGMRGEVEQDTSTMQPEQAAQVAQDYSDLVVGFKAAHYSGPEFTATKRAIEADEVGGRDLPVMVDYGAVGAQLETGVENPLDDLLNEIMREGDILTHCYSDYSAIDGEVNPAALEAYERGVLFDVGHGGGSFQWSDAIPMIREDILAQTISTDLHASSRLDGMKNMNNVMSKFLRLGWSMEEVIKRSTWNPAQIIGRPDLGHLSEGVVADVAVLSIQTGNFGLVDASNYRLDAYQKIQDELTLKGGEVVYDLNGLTSPQWEPWDAGGTA
jgi:dihydroorotase